MRRPWRERRQQRLGLLALMRCGQHRDAPAGQRAVRCGQTQRQLGKALGAPLLAAPIRGRADRQHRAAGGISAPAARSWCGAVHRRGSGGGSRSNRRAELANAMLARIALRHDPALAGAQQPGKRRAAQIDDEIPAPGRRPRGKTAANAATSAAFRRRRSVRARAPPRTAAPRPARRDRQPRAADSARSDGRADRSTARHRRCASR